MFHVQLAFTVELCKDKFHACGTVTLTETILREKILNNEMYYTDYKYIVMYLYISYTSIHIVIEFFSLLYLMQTIFTLRGLFS